MNEGRALGILDALFDELHAQGCIDTEELAKIGQSMNTLSKYVYNSEPIVYAKWEWREFYGEPGLILCCSNCRETAGARTDFSRCPHCGAHMTYEMFGIEREGL